MMLHEHHFRAMNTDVGAWVWSAEPPLAQRALAETERFFREAHARFTRFDAASELSALNAASGAPFAASPELFEVVRLAARYFEATGGLFNPSIIGALEAAGYDRTFEAIGQGDDRRVDPSPIGSLAAIEFDEVRRMITLPIGLRLDLGGIVKGWAVQRAAEQLAETGPCLVDAGGDMQTFGVLPGSTAWPIEVVNPFDHEQGALTLRLRDRAVATSGVDRRKWQRGGVWQHHLIDPRTGRPSTSDVLTATVIAPRTVEAEVNAKTVFLLGVDAGLDYLNERPALAGCVITTDGQLYLSERLKEFIDVTFTYADHPVA